MNLSSRVSETPPPNGSVYSATKGAIDVITMGLAKELGPKGIRVNAVAPGFTKTEGTHGWDEVEKFAISRTPLGRPGHPDEVADVVVFLASDDARWVTGEIVQAGGGLKM